jgi:hypothetical protein
MEWNQQTSQETDAKYQMRRVDSYHEVQRRLGCKRESRKSNLLLAWNWNHMQTHVMLGKLQKLLPTRESIAMFLVLAILSTNSRTFPLLQVRWQSTYHKDAL